MCGCFSLFLFVSSHLLIILSRKTSDLAVMSRGNLTASSEAGAKGSLGGSYGIGLGVLVSRGLDRSEGSQLDDTARLLARSVIGLLKPLNEDGLTAPPKVSLFPM